MVNRIDKVNSLLEHEIGKIISHDFGFSDALVTLTHVEATPNLIEARCFISVMPETKTVKVLEILNKGVYSVQKKINKMVNMRPVPRIIFVKDKVISEASRIEEILAKLKNQEK